MNNALTANRQAVGGFLHFEEKYNTALDLLLFYCSIRKLKEHGIEVYFEKEVYDVHPDRRNKD